MSPKKPLGFDPKILKLIELPPKQKIFKHTASSIFLAIAVFCGVLGVLFSPAFVFTASGFIMGGGIVFVVESELG